MRKMFWIAVIFLGLAGCAAPEGFIARDYWVYVGTYTHAPSRSQGIYLCRFDALTGQTLLMGTAAKVDDPGFQAVWPDERYPNPVLPVGCGPGHFLYSTASVKNGAEGCVDAFALNPVTGALTFLNRQSSGGAGPAHVMVDPQNHTAWVANYGGGTVAALPIEPNGQIDPPSTIDKHAGGSDATPRQHEAHPHQCALDPWGRYVLSPDLGMDRIFMMAPSEKGDVVPPQPPPPLVVPAGSGPRHITFSPDGKFAYLINEINSTLIAYDAGAYPFKQIQLISTLPEGFTGLNTAAEVVVHPSGKFLYASNRGADDIARFTIDPSTGLLTLQGFTSAGVKCPRMIAIDPTGRFLFVCNQTSDTVLLYRINPDTGDLLPTDILLHIPTPTCLTFVPIQ